jgi:hypothetical protein
MNVSVLTLRGEKMAKERLSKLQRWVLIHTYLKTVKGNLPSNWREPQATKFSGSYDKDEEKRFRQALFKFEILCNYFNLPFAEWAERKHLRFPWASYFRSIGEDKKSHNQAQVTLFRSLANMEKKGLIQRDNGITLTKAGKNKAEEILKRDI